MPNKQLVSASKIERAYEQKMQMRVPMYSKGCELKIRNALRHFKGAHIDVDFHQQKVTVAGLVNRDEVLATLKAKRKNSQFWPTEDSKEVLGTSGARKGEIMTDAKKPAAACKTKKEVTFADQQDLGRAGAKKGGILKDAKKPAAASKKKKKVTFADQQ